MCLEELCNYLTLQVLLCLGVSPWNENACRNIRTACLLAEGRRALIDYGPGFRAAPPLHVPAGHSVQWQQ